MWLEKNNFSQNFKRYLQKGHFIRLLLVIWVMFSFFYIAYDQWKDFQRNALQKAYIAGKVDFVRGFMIEANKDTCEIVTVFFEDEEVSVVNVECLKKEIEE